MIWDSHYPAKVHPSTKKIKRGTLQHAPENTKNVCAKVSVSHKMFALIFKIKLEQHIFGDFLAVLLKFLQIPFELGFFV